MAALQQLQMQRSKRKEQDNKLQELQTTFHTASNTALNLPANDLDVSGKSAPKLELVLTFDDEILSDDEEWENWERQRDFLADSTSKMPGHGPPLSNFEELMECPSRFRAQFRYKYETASNLL